MRYVRGVNPASAKTQRQKVLEVLVAARGSEVPSYSLSRIALQYNARLKELRRAGLYIVSRTVWRDGKRLGFFRLLQQGPHEQPSAPADNSRETLSLFGDLSIMRYPD